MDSQRVLQSQPHHQQQTRLNHNSNSDAAIIEDDQQLYDWGIENRLDQYYQDNPNHPNNTFHQHHHHHNQHEHYVPNDPNLQGDYSNQQQPYPLPPEDAHHMHYHQRLTPPPTPQHSSLINASNRVVDISASDDSTIIPTVEEDVAVKTEPGIEANTQFYTRTSGRRPSLPQFDMDANEVLKVERKRARNRVAASKCRLRKLERINVLDQQAQQLRSENEELSALADKLRSQVYSLKQELRWHVNNGCQVFASKSSQAAISPDSTTTTSTTTCNKKEASTIMHFAQEPNAPNQCKTEIIFQL